jgi:hypothetical protein
MLKTKDTLIVLEEALIKAKAVAHALEFDAPPQVVAHTKMLTEIENVIKKIRQALQQVHDLELQLIVEESWERNKEGYLYLKDK